MGLFQNKQHPKKKAPIDETSDGIQHFFEGYFADLRERGRTHFQKTIDERSDAFSKDLEATIIKAETEIKAHITEKLDQQITENSEVIKHVQDQALETLTKSATDLQQQHQQLTETLQKTVAEQQVMLQTAFDENKAQIAAMKEAQATAVQWLNQSANDLHTQHQQLLEAMQKNLAEQQAIQIAAFEDNMAQVIEHYLLEALGDQYDMKAQLPSIIKQMEDNKQAIADDMKL